MISKRNFFSITIMMIVMFFLFQYSMVVRDVNNDYNVNDNITQTNMTSKNAFRSKAVKKNYILYVGSSHSKLEEKVAQWATYSKYNFISETKFQTENTIPQMLVLESEQEVKTNCSILKKMASQGCVIVVANLVNLDDISNSNELKEFLGIRNIKQDTIHLKGINLYKDLFIGNETLYQANTKKEKKEKQDLDLDVPWIQTATGTKSYMVGVLSEKYKDVKNENLPTLIWRNGYNTGSIYCVVGNYLTKNSGFGIFTGMMAQAKEAYAYPIVNAQNLLVVGYPDFTDENGKELNKLYSQDATGISRDVLLPSLISLSQQANMKMTWFMQPQYDYVNTEKPKLTELTFYLKQLKEQHAEAGLSMTYKKTKSVKNKILQDNHFLMDIKNIYLYGAAYVNEEDLPAIYENKKNAILYNVNSFVLNESQNKPVLAYDKENCTIQRVTSDIVNYTYSDDLNMQGIESALGYTNATLYMQNVYYPRGSKDGWQHQQEKFASNLMTYWKDYKMFDSTTISQSDTRVRRFLNLDYSQELKGNIFHLTTTKKNTYFILRIQNKEIKNISGGSFKKIRDGIYLIHAKSKDVRIQIQYPSLKYKG